MAEAWLNKLGSEQFDASSAGFEPGTLNPLAVEVMREVGVDISQNQTKGVFDLFQEGKLYYYVITVCDESSAERCPIFPGVVRRLHWSFEDPSAMEGSHEEKVAKTRLVRDAIKKTVEEFIAIVTSGKLPPNYGR